MWLRGLHKIFISVAEIRVILLNGLGYGVSKQEWRIAGAFMGFRALCSELLTSSLHEYICYY
jgi:hypothetical protein